MFVFIATSTLITYAFEAMSSYYEDYDYNVQVTASSENSEVLSDIVQNEKFDDYSLIYDVARETGFSLMELTDQNILSDFAIERMGNDVDSNFVPQVTLKGLNSKDFKEFVESLNLNYENVKDKAILNDYTNLYTDDGKTIRGRTLNYKNGDTISANLDGLELKLEIAKIVNEKPRGLEDTTYGNGLVIVNIDEYGDEINFVPVKLAIKTAEAEDTEKI